MAIRHIRVLGLFGQSDVSFPSNPAVSELYVAVHHLKKVHRRPPIGENAYSEALYRGTYGRLRIGHQRFFWEIGHEDESFWGYLSHL